MPDLFLEVSSKEKCITLLKNPVNQLLLPSENALLSKLNHILHFKVSPRLLGLSTGNVNAFILQYLFTYLKTTHDSLAFHLQLSSGRDVMAT